MAVNDGIGLRAAARELQSRHPRDGELAIRIGDPAQNAPKARKSLVSATALVLDPKSLDLWARDLRMTGCWVFILAPPQKYFIPALIASRIVLLIPLSLIGR